MTRATFQASYAMVACGAGVAWAATRIVGCAGVLAACTEAAVGGMLAMSGGGGGVPLQASEAFQASYAKVACDAGSVGATSRVADCGGMSAVSAEAAAGAARAGPEPTVVGSAMVERAWSGNSIGASSSLEL